MAQMATGNPEDALDLLQDAMLGFVRKYADKPEEEWPPIFYRILQSRITDWYRRAAVRNRFRVWFGAGKDDENGDVDEIQNMPDTRSAGPAENMLRRVEANAIEKALRTLPLRQQQAFLLRAWEGLDVKGTAFAMGCSEGSVKTHYSRAVHTLRILLEEHRP